jgi:hypothetical protein
MKIGESGLLFASGQESVVCTILFAFILLLPCMVRADWPGVGDNLAVCTATGEQYIPQLVSDGRDGCVVVWFDTRNGMELINVFAQRISAQGDILWTPSGVQLTNVPSYTWISYLVACADGNGGAFFAWEDPRNANFDVYVQHVDSTGIASWPDNGVRLSMTGDDDYVMDIAFDETGGGCIVAWYTAGATESIFAQRINSAGAKMWDTAGVVLSTGTDYATRARIESDGGGGIVACWLDGRYHPAWNDFKDIYAQRVDSTGAVCWADTGVVVLGLGSAPHYAFPELMSNDAGRFYVAWYDWRASGFDIYAQCMSDSGAVLWTGNGAAVCLNPLDQVSPCVAPGAADDLYCAWRDDYTSIRAQHLDASGAMLWASGGVIAAGGSSETVFGSTFRTSNGLFAVVYGENIGSTSNKLVKGQALDASGSLMWSAGGEPVSTVDSPKSNIKAIPDTCGGIITIWTDDRNGSYTSDIFAQRVDPSVYITESKLSPQDIHLMNVTPNPCRNTVSVRYSLDRAMPLVVSLYDITGCRVCDLFSGVQAAGVHALTLDVTEPEGQALSGGLYFLSLEAAGAARIVHKVILMQ